MPSPPERGAWVREDAWTLASPRGGEGRLAELANCRGAEHTSHSPHPPAPPRALHPSSRSLSPLHLSLFFFFLFLSAAGTDWGQKRALRAISRRARREHLESSGSASVPGLRVRVYALPPRVGAPPPLTFVCRHHPRCSK